MVRMTEAAEPLVGYGDLQRKNWIGRRRNGSVNDMQGRYTVVRVDQACRYEGDRAFTL
jgi:hypothetical protein